MPDETKAPLRRPRPWRLREALILAVIGVVALAIGLPFLVMVRAAADKVGCAANLRRVAQAFHTNHNDHAKLPAGGWNQLPVLSPLTFECQGVGPFAACLPYLDAGELAGLLKPTKLLRAGRVDPPVGFDFGLDSLSAHWTTRAENLTLAGARLPWLRCPADVDRDETPVATFVHLGTVGLTFTGGHLAGPTTGFLGRTNYVPVCGSFQTTDPFYGQWEGLMLNRGDITLGQLAALDGTSNIVMIGEWTGGPAPGAGGGRSAISWMAGNCFPAAWGIRPAAEANWWSMSSRHRTVVQVAFAEASVRGFRFSRGSDVIFSNYWYTLMELVGRQDAGRGDAPLLDD